MVNQAKKKSWLTRNWANFETHKYGGVQFQNKFKNKERSKKIQKKMLVFPGVIQKHRVNHFFAEAKLFQKKQRLNKYSAEIWRVAREGRQNHRVLCGDLI